MNPYLDVFMGLAEVLDLVKPKIVAYIDPDGESDMSD